MQRSFKGWGNCQVCKKPIRDPARAAVGVCYKRLAAYDEALAAWAAESVESVEGVEIITSFEGHPELVDWAVTHTACACAGCGSESGCDYWFYCTRFDSLGKVVAWTLHLMEKEWFKATDWEGLVRRLYGLPAT